MDQILSSASFLMGILCDQALGYRRRAPLSSRGAACRPRRAYACRCRHVCERQSAPSQSDTGGGGCCTRRCVLVRTAPAAMGLIRSDGLMPRASFAARKWRCSVRAHAFQRAAAQSRWTPSRSGSKGSTCGTHTQGATVCMARETAGADRVCQRQNVPLGPWNGLPLSSRGRCSSSRFKKEVSSRNQAMASGVREDGPNESVSFKKSRASGDLIRLLA